MPSSPAASSSGFVTYSAQTLQRAEQALRCAPFQLPLLLAMDSQSIPLPAITDGGGVQQGYVTYPLSEGRVERELMWLIQVGILRREVDGQGITDSFRLTPLGKQILSQWQSQGEKIPPATAWDRIRNQVRRWLAFSF